MILSIRPQRAWGRKLTNLRSRSRDGRLLPGVPLGLVGEIDDPGPALDVVEGQEAPVAAVGAVVAIVAHGEAMAGRDDDRAEVVADEIVVMIGVVPGIDLGVVVDLVGLVEGLVVDEDLLVLDLDLLAFEADDPLDEVLVQLPGVLEDDDVVPLDGLVGQEDALRAAGPAGRRPAC